MRPDFKDLKPVLWPKALAENKILVFLEAEIYFFFPIFSSHEIRRVSKPAILTERLSTLAWYPPNTGFFLG